MNRRLARLTPIEAEGEAAAATGQTRRRVAHEHGSVLRHRCHEGFTPGVIAVDEGKQVARTRQDIPLRHGAVADAAHDAAGAVGGQGDRDRGALSAGGVTTLEGNLYHDADGGA